MGKEVPTRTEQACPRLEIGINSQMWLRGIFLESKFALNSQIENLQILRYRTICYSIILNLSSKALM